MSIGILRLGAIVVAAALIAAGCTGSSNSSNTASTSTSAAPAATAAPTASDMSGGAPKGSPVKIPASLHCPDAIVWVNLSTKVYHMPGDRYYGHTKHGEYECQSMADGKGYHLAGTPQGHTGSKMTGGTPQPAPAST